MNFSITKKIATDIVSKISRNELVIDQQIPTEAQIALAYNASRIVVRNAYKILLEVGAIYVLPKKGYFVARHFAGLAKPYMLGYVYDNVDVEWTSPSTFLSKYLLNNEKKVPPTVLLKKFIGNGMVIAVAEYVIPDSIRKNIQDYEHPIDYLIENSMLISSVITSTYEKDPIFSQAYQLAEYKIHYCTNDMIMLARYVVNPPFFKSTRLEKVI